MNGIKKFKSLFAIMVLSATSVFGQSKKLIKSFKLGNVGYNLFSQNEKPSNALNDTTFYLIYRVGNVKALGKEIKEVKVKKSGEILVSTTYRITEKAIIFTKNGYGNKRYLQNDKGKLSIDEYDNARPVADTVGAQGIENNPISTPASSTEKIAPNDTGNPHMDILPQYPGGIDRARNYIAKYLRYPDLAVENNVEGIVIVTFVIEKDGRINDIKIEKGLGYGCDEEVIKVITHMPKWSPAKVNGKYVRYRMRMPVSFRSR